MFVTACDNSYVDMKPRIPAGMGALTLRIDGDARTILPDVTLQSFTYDITFYPHDTDAELVEFTGTYAQLTAKTFYLLPGDYDLGLIAYLSSMGRNRPAAEILLEGDDKITIVQGGNISVSISLTLAGIGSGDGSFSWSITFPNPGNVDIRNASMNIKSLSINNDYDETLFFIEEGMNQNINNFIDLESGYYQVTFNLERIESWYEPLVWQEILHVYTNLNSHFVHEFYETDFNVTKYTITFKYHDGETTDGKQTRAHGTALTAPYPDPVWENYYNFQGWSDNPDSDPAANDKWSFGPPGGTFLGSQGLPVDLTLHAKWKPILRGEPSIDGEYKIGNTLTVNTDDLYIGTVKVSDLTIDSTGFTYSWRIGNSTATAANGTGNTFVILGEHVGQTISCVITRADADGSVTANDTRIVPYTIKLALDGDYEDGENIVSFVDFDHPDYPLDETIAFLDDIVTVYFIIADSKNKQDGTSNTTQEVLLSFMDEPIMRSDTDNGKSSEEYTVVHAASGTITINAQFIHTSLIMLDPPTGITFNQTGIITFTAGNNNGDSSDIWYTAALFRNGAATNFSETATSGYAPAGIVDRMLEASGEYTVRLTAHTTDPLYRGSSTLSAVSGIVYVHSVSVDIISTLDEEVNGNSSNFELQVFRGSDVTLTAEPNPGRKVTWTGSGTDNGDNTYTIINIQANISVTAAFSADSELEDTDFEFDDSDKEYDGTPQGVEVDYITGINTTTAGTITTWYSGAGYGPTQTPPVNAGTYNVLVTTGGGTIYEAIPVADRLPIGGFVILPKPLGISSLEHTREYNGYTAAAGVIVHLVSGDRIGSDDVISNTTVNAAYTSTAAGTKEITISEGAVTLHGTASDNYTVLLPVTKEVSNEGITRRVLTISSVTHTKVYDGTKTATDGVSVTLDNIAPGDSDGAINLTYPGVPAEYTENTAGSRTVIVNTGAIELSGTAPGNYTITPPAEHTMDETNGITRKRLIVSNLADSKNWTKVYNGNTTYTHLPGEITFNIDAIVIDSVRDDVTVSVTSAVFNNPNANSDGSERTITISFGNLSGDAAANYLTPIASTVPGSIIKAPGVAVNPPSEASKTSNSITIAAVSYVSPPGNGQAFEYSIITNAEFISGDFVVEVWQDGLTFTSLSPNTEYIVFARTKDNANYLAGTESPSLPIKTIALTLNAGHFTFDSTPRIYNVPSLEVVVNYVDGISTATAGNINVYYSGASGTAYTQSSTPPINVGTYNILVETSGGSTYAEIDTPLQLNGTLIIEPKDVTIIGLSANNKVYNGNLVANDNRAGMDIEGNLDEGNLIVNNALGTATFADRHVGDNKIVTFTGYALDGTAAPNYNLSAQPASVTANITRRPIVITNLTDSNNWTRQYNLNDNTYYSTQGITFTTDILPIDRLPDNNPPVTVTAASATYNAPTVAGANQITVTFTINNNNGNYATSVADISVNDLYTLPNTGPRITRANGGGVSAPTFASSTLESITINAVSVSSPYTEQVVEYAIVVSPGAAPTEASAWKTQAEMVGLTFGSLSSGTNYNIFARTRVSANYYTGSPSNALLTSTLFVGPNASDFNFTSVTGTYTSVEQPPVTVTYNNTNMVTEAGQITVWYSGPGYTRSETPPTNAGIYNISVTTAGGSVYAAVQEPGIPLTGTLTIDKAPITITGLGAENKTYDGNPSAVAVTSSVNISGRFAADASILDFSAGTAAFADRNAQNGKPVTFTGYTLTGSAASNYHLASVNSVTASITRRPITISYLADSNGWTRQFIPNDTSYPITADITFNTDILPIDRLPENDPPVTVTAATATYNLSTVAGANQITVTFTINNNNGNYETTIADSVVTASITKADGGAVGAPTLASRTQTSITINAVSPPNTEQGVQYAINTENTAPAETSSAWGTGLTFNSLTHSTNYYIFARSGSSANYNIGTPGSALHTSTTFNTVLAIIFNPLANPDNALQLPPDFVNKNMSIRWYDNTKTDPEETVAITLPADLTYTQIEWYFNGSLAPAANISADRRTYTLKGSDFRNTHVGDHYLTAEVVSGGIPYGIRIDFKVIN